MLIMASSKKPISLELVLIFDMDNLNKKASFFIAKAIRSGFANLSNTSEESLNKGSFYISEAFVSQGPSMKRFRPAAMGRATPILKRSSHITITLNDNTSKLRSEIGTKN